MTNQENPARPQRTYERRQPAGSSLSPGIVLIIIVAVIYFIANDHRSRASERRVTDSTFSANAFLSGVEQDIESSEFRGGDASVFMGGAEVDLRRTTMLSDEATIDLSVMMGGMEIRVPRDWTVVNRITPVLGGVKNETRSTPGGKRIVLKGSVVMGGVEIKN